MWPFELVATATDSPRYSPGGSFKKFGTDENSISGTCSIVALRWANVGAVARVARTTDDGRIHFMETSPNVPIGITILTELEEGYDTVPSRFHLCAPLCATKHAFGRYTPRTLCYNA